MEEKHVAVLVLGAIVMIAMSGVAFFVTSPEFTGSVSTLQQMGAGRTHGAYSPLVLGGGVRNQPDPHTQFINVDDGVCKLYLKKPVTFLTWVNHQCRELNWGRQKREADCRYQAEIDAEIICRQVPVFANVQAPQYITGEVPANPLACASLAENYDFVLQQTMSRERPPLQTIAVIDPCTGVAGTATRMNTKDRPPVRSYTRTSFPNRDVMGEIIGASNELGQVRYLLCTDGRARVIVSGVPVCNTL